MTYVLIMRYELCIMNYEGTLFQSRLSVIVIPDLIREPDEYTLKSPTLLLSTGSRVKHGMT